MMTATRLCLHNTLTGRKEIFRPRDRAGPVKLFTCGPSIYNQPHIGNYRTFLYEDILQRYLEYLGYEVKRLINFTDVEDKSIERAKETGLTVSELTEPVAERFHRECAVLQIQLPPGPVPRSSTSVDQAVVLIQRLLEKGYAYRHRSDIFFDPLKFKGFGKLFGVDMSRWPKKKVRFRKDTYPGQRWNLGDFILWRGCPNPSSDEPCWDTALGRGRPAWNIQDPAMITKHLGYQVDISCGGIDNLYRHHDYNIAVIEGVSGRKFAETWLHGEHVLCNGRKMSKSRGNIVYLSELMALGYRPHHLRFYLCYGHYREKLNLNSDRLDLARGRVDSFRDMAASLSENSGEGRSDKTVGRLIDSLVTRFENQMNDDLNVRQAFDEVHGVVTELARLKAAGKISSSDSRRAADALARIDSVWRFLG